jgi:hypothetical protein
MNAPAPIQLPLGGGESSTPPKCQRPAAGGETCLENPQYLRLFGQLTPDQVFLGAPLPANCDPTQAAGHLLSPVDAVALLRQRHREKGFTIERDAQHGQQWFWHVAHEFWWKAQDAYSDPELRRKHKIAAAAMIIASIEADDFLAQQQQQEAASHVE